MKNGTSPGSDGFTVEFFKFFWNDMGTLLVRAINESFRKESLSSPQKEGLITLLPKGDKPRQFLKNWRPITLLNVSYKIASGCIANRIKRVLPNIIHSDQTGFINGRCISKNTRLLYDIIHYTETRNIPGLLVLIDFEKAFDSVSWSFIKKTLSFFRFGPDIKKWIEIFYRNIKSCVVVNGQVSTLFQIERGCRQGDPLSPYIYLLCAEILAVRIRQSSGVTEIKIKDVEYLISQFADDTSIYLDGSRESFENVIKILTEFVLWSGLKINYDKSQVVWLGSQKGSATVFLPHLKLKWNPTRFSVLGIQQT